VSELTRFTPEKVFEKYGLTPAQYPDFAALRGDPSDNLPGIPGVGEKTAAKWINQFGSFAELVERVDEVKGKAGQNLRDHLEAVKAQPPAHRAGARGRAAEDGRRPGARAVRPQERRDDPGHPGDPQPLPARAALRRRPRRRGGGGRAARRGGRGGGR